MPSLAGGGGGLSGLCQIPQRFLHLLVWGEIFKHHIQTSL